MDEELRKKGWVPIKEQMPPMGEEVVVMRVHSYNHQEAWWAKFRSEAEVLASGVTHWGKIENKERKEIEI